MREADLVSAILLAASAVRRPDGSPVCVLWKQVSGVFVAPPNRRIRAGLEGMADLGGILWTGRSVQIEVKSQTGRLREAQVRWGEMCRRMGALYLVARSVDEVTMAIRTAK